MTHMISITKSSQVLIKSIKSDDFLVPTTNDDVQMVHAYLKSGRQ